MFELQIGITSCIFKVVSVYPEGHYGATCYIPGVTNVFFTEEHVDFLNEFEKKQCESQELSTYHVQSAWLHELIDMHLKSVNLIN